MKIVGLTGGIGSGKTTVARMFNAMCVPVYNSDERAKELMVKSEDLVNGIKSLLGEKAYTDNVLNREYVARKVFADKELLQSLNALVHPAVRNDFNEWADKQDADYVIQEAAILFENGAYEKFDRMILVTAPKMIRLKRIMQRDNESEDNILARMSHQWDDVKKSPLAHFVIENTDLEKTKTEVQKIHEKLSELSTSTGI